MLEDYIKDVKEYLDQTAVQMGSTLSFFLLTIEPASEKKGNSGKSKDSAFVLKIWPEQQTQPAANHAFVHKIGPRASEVGYTVEEYPFGRNPFQSFEYAQELGRVLFFALRRDYPIHRRLNWPYNK